MSKKKQQQINEAIAMQMEAAQEAGAMGYMARAMAMASLPHRDPGGDFYSRENGAFSLHVAASKEGGGVPYGSLPRLLISWITTEAVREKTPELVLGASLSEFLSKLGITAGWGPRGSVTTFRSQLERLAGCSITAEYRTDEQTATESVKMIRASNLWWHPKTPEQTAMWQSTLTLTTDFYNELITRPVPVDLRALRVLKGSPMALDIYIWLTHRMSYLSRDTRIPWEALQLQFGAGYPTTARGLRNFRQAFRRALKKVQGVYQEARVIEDGGYLKLRPSRTHVPRIDRPGDKPGD